MNGRVSRAGQDPPAPAGVPFWRPYEERNVLFANNGGTLTDMTEAVPAFSAPGVYRGVATADVDNDGGVNLLVTRVDGPVQLLRNVVPSRGHWVAVSAVEPARRRLSYDAVVTVKSASKTWTKWMNPGRGFGTSVDPRAHVGLGALDRVDAFEVLWPDGRRESFAGGPADRIVTLSKGQGRAIDAPRR